jgi:hypothetical protein
MMCWANESSAHACIAALEVMSRFAASPKWLIYLPPTMSPSATTRQPGLLEHPAEAFACFADENISRVVCEEKHMGSRAVVIICRDETAAQKVFGVTSEGSGIVYTRTRARVGGSLMIQMLKPNFSTGCARALTRRSCGRSFRPDGFVRIAN